MLSRGSSMHFRFEGVETRKRTRMTKPERGFVTRMCESEVRGLTDSELVVRIRAGDPSALGSLYHTYAMPGIRTALLITRNQESAEDALQEAFVQVMRNIGSLRDPGAFRSWFYRVLINAAKRLARYRSRVVSLDLSKLDLADPSSVLPDEATVHSEEVQALRKALGELPDLYRVPMILRYYTGLSEQETAATMGIPLGTLKTRLHTARKILQDRLMPAGRKGGTGHA